MQSEDNQNNKPDKKQIEELKGIRLFVAISGSGKSYLTKEYPSHFVDHDGLRDRFRIGLPLDATDEEVSLRRTESGKTMAEEAAYSEQVMLDALSKDDGKIILTSPVPYVMESIKKHKLPYVMITYDQTNPELIQEFRKRRLRRGDTEQIADWLEGMMYDYNDQWLNDNDANAVFKLSKGKYIADVIDLVHGTTFSQNSKGHSVEGVQKMIVDARPTKTLLTNPKK